MDFNVLCAQEREAFIAKGEDVLNIFYLGDVPGNSCDLWILRLNGVYAISTDWGEAYGPIPSFEKALQWEGFDYASQDFELFSEELSLPELNVIENDFRDRMRKMANK
jgi:hypothetical protein